MKKISVLAKVFKRAFSEFLNDNAIKLSASLSYYTIFSIAPLLIIIISLAGIFFGVDAVEGRIYDQIKGLVGSSAAVQIQDIIKNVRKSQNTHGGAVLAAVLLF